MDLLVGSCLQHFLYPLNCLYKDKEFLNEIQDFPYAQEFNLWLYLVNG